ncbi:unnamed protein product [Ilex paraguariensis]|uniref:Uncharacterized protein n=1 Tax=Ilex paraguariensis TaxID=185542 RepID=A0ABC8S9Y2_9AQUA
MDAKPEDTNTEHMSMKFGNERQSTEGFTLMGAPTNFIGGFGSYSIEEMGRFSAEQFPATYSGNGVSLTLGLPHCENLSMPGARQTYLPNQNIQLGRGVEIGEANEFGTINTQNIFSLINHFKRAGGGERERHGGIAVVTDSFSPYSSVPVTTRKKGNCM